MINSVDRSFLISNTSNIGIRKTGKKEEKPLVTSSDSVQISSINTGKISDNSTEKKISSKTCPVAEKENNNTPPVDAKTEVDSKEAAKKNKAAGNQVTTIFMDDGTSESRELTSKQKIINSLIDPGMKPERQEALKKRLEKYPEAALRLIQDDGASYSKKKSGFVVTKRLGYYTHEGKTIHLANGTLSDFAKNHKGIAKAFSGSKPALYAMAGVGIAAASPFVLPALAAGVVAACFAPLGLASVPVGLLVTAGTTDVPVHETGHALDYALGRRGKFKDMKIDDRFTQSLERQRRQDVYNGVLNMPKPVEKLNPENQPASVKSKEIMDCYEACKDWKNKDAQFLTDYAGTNPKEYFAECVKAYLNTDTEESDICREDLIKKDPKMYNFVDNLFKEINAGVYS